MRCMRSSTLGDHGAFLDTVKGAGDVVSNFIQDEDDIFLSVERWALLVVR